MAKMRSRLMGGVFGLGCGKGGWARLAELLGRMLRTAAPSFQKLGRMATMERIRKISKMMIRALVNNLLTLGFMVQCVFFFPFYIDPQNSDVLDPCVDDIHKQADKKDNH